MIDKVKLYKEWYEVGRGVYTVIVYLGSISPENQIYATQVVVNTETRLTTDGAHVDSGTVAADIVLSRLAGRMAVLLSHNTNPS
jgi:hypothetical protein